MLFRFTASTAPTSGSVAQFSGEEGGGQLAVAVGPPLAVGRVPGTQHAVGKVSLCGGK